MLRRRRASALTWTASAAGVVFFVVMVSAAEGQQDRSPREQLDRVIAQLGRTPPRWFDEIQPNIPKTLDLDWPLQPTGPWNNQKNVGQFYWDIVHPNPARWREGVRLMHQLLDRHQQDPEKRERCLLALGRMYHDLIEDYARAAFWYRAAGVEKDPSEYAHSATVLAECYWRLGHRDAALELLDRIPDNLSKAKLLGDLGETERALKIAQAEAIDSPDYGFLVAGDACRQVGRYDDALKYYQRVVELKVPEKNPPGRLLKNRNRALANVQAIRLFELFDPENMPDGRYVAVSQGYEGPVEVSVAVLKGRIEQVKVVSHREKQFYSALTDTPSKIVAKQAVKGVDATSNATITSEAIINATAKALANGPRP